METHKINYLYPPRPEYCTSPQTLDKYDNGSYFAQPKLNGSMGVLWIFEDGYWELWNRHGQKMTNYKNLQFEKLFRGKKCLTLVGEYLNKNKKGIDGKEFNHKFIIFDILVYENNHLTGITFWERQELLRELFPDFSKEFRENQEYSSYLHTTEHKDTFRVKNFTGNFSNLYNEITKWDVFEGLVIKKAEAKLSPCLNEGNNSGWQIKARKSTKNYQF